MNQIKIFVHLGPGFDAAAWRERYERGLIPGINEPLPYGYNRVGGEGFEIKYSQDAKEGRLTAFFRRVLCRTVGFDMIHAWRNRRGIMTADVVWTHTEREHMAALTLFCFKAADKRPRIIAQCIWLFDKWPRFSCIRRSVYTRLLRQADIVSTLSPANLKVAQRLLPDSRTELVMFGIKSEHIKQPGESACHRPVRIAALGNDMHRDWTTLLQAFGGLADFELRIVSAKFKGRSAQGNYNVRIETARTAERLEHLYDWADMVVAPLKPNLHASGLSVILEATISGRPVISTDTGGLRAYFSDEEVCYVPVDDAMSMRHTARELAENNSWRLSLVRAAQRRIVEGGLTSETYALRHRELSLELLGISRPQVLRYPVKRTGSEPGQAWKESL